MSMLWMVPGSISRATCVAPSPPRIEIQDGSVASSSIRVAPTTAGAEVLGTAGAVVLTTAAGFAGIDCAGTDGAAAGCSGVVDAGVGAAATGCTAGFTGTEADVISGGLAGRLGQSNIPIRTAATISPAEIAVGDRHQAGESVSVNTGESTFAVGLQAGGAEGIGATAESGAGVSAGGGIDTGAAGKEAGAEDAAAADARAAGTGAVTVSSRMAACSQKPSTADSSRPMLCSASTDLERKS